MKGVVTIQIRVRVNEGIRIKEIRAIGENGEQIGVIATSEALKMAKESGLDLVEVAPKASPPVCRIMNFSKYKYEQEKKERLARKKQRVIRIKEIKLKPNIEENDYQVKLRHLKRFLGRGDKAKVTLIFRGREMAHTDIGASLMNRLMTDLSEVAVPEKVPTLENKMMILILNPK
ncbi:MAG: translation initiation factor IF-3 [Candidatus Omnitrophica bacterium]|nr:translation initiation factor IF-3 [Candidatus Omnitrophota bacterium]